MAFLMLLALLGFSYRMYSRNYNTHLNAMYGQILEKYPEVTSVDLMEVMNGNHQTTKNYFAIYGIDLRKDSVIAQNDKIFTAVLCGAIGVFVCFASVLFALYLHLERKTDKRIIEITQELARINAGDYSYNMNASEEGQISILENEMYKTAIRLKESAENSRRDKEHLKESLSDISHQLKTPLTALQINLDNLEEHPNLPEEKKQMILTNAKREVSKVNIMIQQLLKLSRFDANAIEFEKIQASVYDLLQQSVENVSALCDLRGVELCIHGDGPQGAICVEEKLCCDAYWEVEAISNILKNGVEHAKSRVDIVYHNYELYKEIVIANDGPRISDADARKIFTRYYRGESSTIDSVGIGLSLADSIVKQDGGYIFAEATDEGTRFVIRYTKV